MAASTPMMATTISNSTSVKPFWTPVARCVLLGVPLISLPRVPVGFPGYFSEDARVS